MAIPSSALRPRAANVVQIEIYTNTLTDWRSERADTAFRSFVFAVK